MLEIYRSHDRISFFPKEKEYIYSLYKKSSGIDLSGKPPNENIVIWSITQKEIKNEYKISLILEYFAESDIKDEKTLFDLLDGNLIATGRDDRYWAAIYYCRNKNARLDVVIQLLSKLLAEQSTSFSVLHEMVRCYSENPKCKPEDALFLIRRNFGSALNILSAKHYCKNKNADMSIFSKLIDENEVNDLRIPYIDRVLNEVIKSKRCTKEIIKKMLTSSNKEIKNLAMSHRFAKKYSCFT